MAISNFSPYNLNIFNNYIMTMYLKQSSYMDVGILNCKLVNYEIL